MSDKPSFEDQKVFYDASTPQKVIAKALIESDMVIERRLGEAMVNANDVLDMIRVQGWDVVQKEAAK